VSTVSLSAWLQALDQIEASAPTYRLGGDGSDGTCDCIGLLIGGLKRNGVTWPGIHGSNWAARNVIRALSPITGSDDLAVGDVVFKARSPGDVGYSLPDRYADHPDRLDYYHVGVVRQVSPLEIMHCTTPGIRRDTRLGAWAWKGRLTLIQQEDASPLRHALVTAATGSTVNLRRTPDGALVVRVPVGETVTLHETSGIWSRITWHTHSGWMKTAFLSPEEEVQETPLTLTALQERIARLENRVTALEEASG